MKRNIALMSLVCMLLVTLTAAAGDDFSCSPANVAGTWGYIETATIVLQSPTNGYPAGTYPYASVGIYALDSNGNLSGKRTASLAGTPLRATIVGTATVNPDCTGEENLTFYDESGNLAGTATKAVLYVNKGQEVNKIIINPMAFPMVAITRAKRVLPGSKNLLDLEGDKGKRAFGCSSADLEGQWGTTMEGRIMTSPTSSIPFGAANKGVYDSKGNFEATQIRSVNGTVSNVHGGGTYTLNPDCTGTKTIKTYDSTDKLLNTATQDFVLVDDANEIFEIFTSNIKHNNDDTTSPVPMVVTGQSQKTFPKGAQALD